MKDADRLRARILAALVVPFLGTALGSCKDPASDDRHASVGISSIKSAQPLATEVPTQQSGGCPSGSWCGTAKIAGRLTRSKATELGCPTTFSWGESPDGGSAPEGLSTRSGDATLDAASTAKARADGGESACCYFWVEPCPGGRPLLEDGRALVADIRPRFDWSGSQSTAFDEIAIDVELYAELAEAWLADARAEHASIAAFARATLELLSLGAPAVLVAGCQRAALDEVRHAEQCFALASRYAGRRLGPGPLRAVGPRASDLETFARDTFIEGCAGETVAALCAARAAEACKDEAVRAVLLEIAEDESRHAALAWSTLAWAVRTGGAPVCAAIRATAAAARGPLAISTAATSAAWAHHGRLDAAALSRARHDAWVGILEPLLADLSRHTGAQPKPTDTPRQLESDYA